MIKKLIKRIEKHAKENGWLFIFFLALPFINDTYPSHYYIYFWMKDFYKIISFLIISFFMIRKKKKLSCLMTFLLCGEMCLWISTFLNHPIKETYVFEKMFYDSICYASIGLLIECFIDQTDDLIDGLMLNYEIALYPCYLGILLNIPENGYYPRGLLNTQVLWILPAIFLASIHMIRNKKYLRSSILITVCLLMVFDVRSATTMVAVTGVFGMFVLFFLFKKIARFELRATWMFTLIFLMSLFILFVYSDGRFAIIDFFLEKVLGKSTTFTERNIIWNEAIEMIRKKPLIGYGSRPLIYAQTSFDSIYIHAHNQFLQKMVEGGILRLLFFLCFNLHLCFNADKKSHALIKGVCMCFLFGIWITYLMEAYKDFYVFYTVFFISYYIEKNAGQNKKRPINANC